jgi:hypothetical protein
MKRAGRARNPELRRRTDNVPWWQRAEDEPDEIPFLESEQHRRYLAAMAAYPKCSCGQGLWAPQSIARGFCEGCRLLTKPFDSS